MSNIKPDIQVYVEHFALYVLSFMSNHSLTIVLCCVAVCIIIPFVYTSSIKNVIDLTGDEKVKPGVDVKDNNKNIEKIINYCYTVVSTSTGASKYAMYDSLDPAVNNLKTAHPGPTIKKVDVIHNGQVWKGISSSHWNVEPTPQRDRETELYKQTTYTDAFGRIFTGLWAKKPSNSIIASNNLTLKSCHEPILKNTDNRHIFVKADSN